MCAPGLGIDRDGAFQMCRRILQTIQREKDAPQLQVSPSRSRMTAQGGLHGLDRSFSLPEAEQVDCVIDRRIFIWRGVGSHSDRDAELDARLRHAIHGLQGKSEQAVRFSGVPVGGDGALQDIDRELEAVQEI